MSNHSTEVPVVSRRRARIDGSASRARVRAPRTDWRLGGRTVRWWRVELLAKAAIALGAALLAGALVTWLWPSPWAGAASSAVILLGMLVPTVLALRRSRPGGLLRVRAVDLLYGLVLGVGLRLTQGWLEVALSGSGAWPSYPLIDGRLPANWWLTDALLPGLAAPVVEEFFFRGVVLVAVFTALRRPVGRMTAAWVAVLVSTGLFVLVHAVVLIPTAGQAIALTLVGLVCSLLVVLTGRIWGAVLTHAVFNLSFVALSAVGTMLG